MNKKDKKSQHIRAFAISAGLAIITVALLTMISELYKPLKNWLAQTFTHHWIGKGVISFIGFYIVGYILSFLVSADKNKEASILFTLFWVSLLSTIAITLFYFYEAFLVLH